MCVLLQVSSVFSPGNFQGFALVNRQRTNRIATGFTVEVSTEGTQLSYTNFDYLGQEPHYWQLPGVYQGDKVSIKEYIQWLNQWKEPKQPLEPLTAVHKGLSSQKLVDHFHSIAVFIFLLRLISNLIFLFKLIAFSVCLQLLCLRCYILLHLFNSVCSQSKIMCTVSTSIT